MELAPEIHEREDDSLERLEEFKTIYVFNFAEE